MATDGVWRKILSTIGWTDFVEDRRWRKNPSPSSADRRARLLGDGEENNVMMGYTFSIHLFRPVSPEPARDMADLLKGGNAVIVDFRLLPDFKAKEVLDFISGVTYGLGGSITKIDKRVYMFSSRGILIRDVRKEAEKKE